MKSIKNYITESSSKNPIEYICAIGNVVWLSTQISELGKAEQSVLSTSGFLQDANCCFKVSTKGTDIAEGSVIILTSHLFETAEEARKVVESYDGDFGDSDWYWDSDGILAFIFGGHALYIGATALQGGSKETASSIEAVLKRLKPA